MGFSLSLLALSAVAAAGADVAPGGAAVASCPADADVAGEIARMGAARALEQTGTTDIAVEDASMRILLRGRDGTILGMREVAAPDACRERAVVAAVVIVAWLGEWTPAATAAASSPASPGQPDAIAVARAPAGDVAPAPTFAPNRRADVAAFGFGARDGDAATWGLGIQAGYGLGRHLSLTAIGETTGQRSRPLGPGDAAYRSLRAGAGVAVRRTFGRALIDAGFAPQAARLSLRGEGLAGARTAAAWGLALDARVRFGLRLAGIVPFVYAGADYALTGARLTLDGSTASATLSRWDFAVGLGILFPFGPLGG